MVSLPRKTQTEIGRTFGRWGVSPNIQRPILCALGFVLMLGAPKSLAAGSCDTAEAEGRIRRVIQTLPTDSPFRRLLEQGMRGTGKVYSWILDMRKQGVRSALVELRFSWSGRPTDISIYRTRFFSGYDAEHDEILDANRLDLIRQSGLQSELEETAIRQTEQSSWAFEEPPADRRDHGVSYVRFLADECLPQEPATLEPLPPDDTPLRHAAEMGDVTVVEQLLKTRPVLEDLNAALVEAVSQDSVRILDLLLEGGADPNAKSRDGEPVLMIAARSGQLRNVSRLIATRANVNANDALGDSTILAMLKYGANPVSDLEVVRMLLRAGADPNMKDSDGKTALEIARAHGMAPFVRLLVQGGAHESNPG